ncbi:MAG: hypothetical protein AAGF11_02580 [Myxococcota bacterium]
MPQPKIFSVSNAGAENYTLDLNRADHVIIYRFGNSTVERDWLSRMRQTNRGGFTVSSGATLNEWALKQTSYGSNSEGIQSNPFLSVATSYDDLFAYGEGWVQEILKQVPHLGVFSVPFTSVYRPRPTKLISRQETEWLYFDGDAELLSTLVEWRDNPYRAGENAA